MAFLGKKTLSRPIIAQIRKYQKMNPNPTTSDPTKPEIRNPKFIKSEYFSGGFGTYFCHPNPTKPESETSEPDKSDPCAPLIQGLLYPSTSSLHLPVYSYSNWASCPFTKRSTTGFCVFLGDCLSSQHLRNNQLCPKALLRQSIVHWQPQPSNSLGCSTFYLLSTYLKIHQHSYIVTLHC